MKYIAWVLLVLSPMTFAQSSMNLAIPTTPQSYQSDRIRSGDLDCSNAIGSSTNFEFGVMGILDQENSYANSILADPTLPYAGNRMTDIAVYARINIPIGGPKERINCNTLYKLELEKKRLELAKLKAELAELRKLQFEN